MAHTNDLMYAALSTYYSVSTESLGDLMARLRAEDPTFAGGTRKEWYQGKLDDLSVSYDEGLHLADLANLLWSQADPLGAATPEFLLLESGDKMLLESGDDIILD
jgi:hypothetical protein